MSDALSTDWHRATQSDVLRAVILSGLKLLEKDHAGKVAEARKKRDAERREAEKAAAEKAAAEKAAPDKPSTPSSKRGKKSKG